MTLVSQKFEVTITLRDSGLDETNKTYQLRAADMASALTAAADFVAVFKTVTQAKVDGYRVSQVFAEDAPENIAGDTVRNSVQAVITVSLATSPLKRGTITIPAPVNALFSATSGAGSDTIDNSAALVLGIVGEFQAAGNVYLSDGEAAAAIPNIKGGRRTVYRKLDKN